MRFRYYFGWLIGDITNNSAGFGYSGYDEARKKHEWKLVENINIWEIESANGECLLLLLLLILLWVVLTVVVISVIDTLVLDVIYGISLSA